MENNYTIHFKWTDGRTTQQSFQSPTIGAAKFRAAMLCAGAGDPNPPASYSVTDTSGGEVFRYPE